MPNDPMMSDRERRALAAIADVLIPAHGAMPSFSQTGAHQAHTDRVLALRPELLADLRAALARVDPDGDAVATAERLNRAHPEAIGVIGVVASAAYYLDPDVRRRLGYPGQVQRPATDAEEHDYEDLIQPVIARGPIFRPTPKD